jgi:hypothetical protein
MCDPLLTVSSSVSWHCSTMCCIYSRLIYVVGRQFEARQRVCRCNLHVQQLRPSVRLNLFNSLGLTTAWWSTVRRRQDERTLCTPTRIRPQPTRARRAHPTSVHCETVGTGRGLLRTHIEPAYSWGRFASSSAIVRWTGIERRAHEGAKWTSSRRTCRWQN